MLEYLKLLSSISSARAIRAGRASMWCECNIGIKPKADPLNSGDLWRLLAGAIGGCAQVAAELGDTSVERILAGGVVVWLAPDGQKATFARADRAGVMRQVQQQAILQRAQLYRQPIRLNRARVLI